MCIGTLQSVRYDTFMSDSSYMFYKCIVMR